MFMVLMSSSGDSGEDASRIVDCEAGAVGDNEGGGEAEGLIALWMLEWRYGKMPKQGIYSTAGPRRFEALLVDRDDILLHMG